LSKTEKPTGKKMKKRIANQLSYIDHYGDDDDDDDDGCSN